MILADKEVKRVMTMSEQQERFMVVHNGYDCYQVNNEIDRLEFQIQTLNEKIVMYQNQIETVNNQFSTIKQRYQMLVNELSMREKAADDVARIALKEANSVIENAQVNADGIIQEAIIDAQSLLSEVEQYNKESSRLKLELRDKMAAFIKVLDQYEDPSTTDLQKMIEEIKPIEKPAETGPQPETEVK